MAESAVKKALLAGGIAVLLLTPPLSRADVGPPAHLRITEREPGLYAAQWRVPKALPPRAVPVPELPEDCAPAGEVTVLDQAGAWLFTREWRCETSLANEIVGMRYPFPDLALTTVARVDLLSGDRFANVLTPGDPPWRLPRGTVPPDLLRVAQRATLSGISHALTSWLHWVFVICVGLLGGNRGAVRIMTIFTLGQVGGVVLTWMAGGVAAVPAQLGFAVAVALLAREAMRPEAQRPRAAALTILAGLLHGLGIAVLVAGDSGENTATVVEQLLAVLGMDSVHILGAALVAIVWTRLKRAENAPRVRDVLAYSAGAVAMAFAFALALSGDLAEPGSAAHSLAPSLPTADRSAGGGAGSRRVAPSAPDVPFQSFLAVEPFEIRHEVMLRLGGLAVDLGLDAEATLEIDDQSTLIDRLVAQTLERAELELDGIAQRGFMRRADFMIVDTTGALPRTFPVEESVSEAVIGLVVSYATDGIPEDLSLTWNHFPTAEGSITATVIDPETVRTVTLTAEDPTLSWQNELVEDPIPTVDAVAVEPTRIPIPLLSLPLLALSVGALVIGMRGRGVDRYAGAARILLALACVAGPLAQTAVNLPGSAGRAPSERQARRILAGLLPNIYRAMEFRDEALIYDQLEVSVTGETLIDVYLEQRRALAMEERGGAQARVEAVEVLEAGEIEARESGFGVRSIWTVGGMVTHFGHRHFRQNRYDARLEIVAVAGTWKIHSLEVLEQDRMR